MSSPFVPVRTLLGSGLLLGSLLVSGASAQGRLEILNNKGELTTLAPVTILAETLDEVRFQREGSDRTENRKSDSVVRVIYGPGSESYETARELLANGKDLTNAANLFAAAADETDPPWVAAHALLGQAAAQAARGQAQMGAALAAIEQFTTRFADHRLLPRALLDKARYAAASGDMGTAGAAVQQVLGLVSSSKVSADWGPRAHLDHGRSLLDAGQCREAGDAFAAAERAAADATRALDPGRTDLAEEVDRLALQARSGVGAAMLACGDVGGARAYFQRLSRDAGDDDPGVSAAAQNGLAECDFADTKLKQAQLGFARVAVAAAGIPDQHAKALYYLGRCADQLGADGKERGGKARAREYYQDVVQRYPGTTWARAAQKSLP